MGNVGFSCFLTLLMNLECFQGEFGFDFDFTEREREKPAAIELPYSTIKLIINSIENLYITMEPLCCQSFSVSLETLI